MAAIQESALRMQGGMVRAGRSRRTGGGIDTTNQMCTRPRTQSVPNRYGGNALRSCIGHGPRDRPP